MDILKNSLDVQSTCCQLPGTIAFVPTMGNLHAGHMQLVDVAKRLADHVVVSIFVNPLQFGDNFGNNKDFSSYPRTLEQDIEKLKNLNVDLLFTPDGDHILPADINTTTFVEVPALSDILEGECRPHHFRGVTTIVNKLFNIVQPDMAVFGKKDFQQLMIIQQMVNDLNMPVSIVGEETVRESDGLAMSSRNSRLGADERQRAPGLFTALSEAQSRILSGDKNYHDIEDAMKSRLQQAGFSIDYFTIRNATNLAPVDAQTTDLVILAAVCLGSTRLIDNLSFSLQ